MKFSLKKISSGGCRLGIISGAGHHGDQTFTTPMCMVYTKKGSVPYLTKDMMSQIERLPPCVHMPLNLIVEHTEQLKKYGKGLGEYTALHNHLIYTSLHDTAKTLPSGYNGRKNVAVWGKGGKITLDATQYIKLQEVCQPDWYQALSDGDTLINGSKKKIQYNVDKTLTFLDECIELHNNSKVLNNTDIFGVIEGGLDVDERCRSARETALRDVAGFTLEGFHNFGPDSEFFSFTTVTHILKKVWECLPEEKPRQMHCVWNPVAVMEAVECGLDIFDSSYPYVVTERNSALVFNYHVDNDVDLTESSSIVTSTDRPFEIDFTDKRYHDDFTPIVVHCTCFTCTHHTRAYLHHLVNTSELLASVLLMMHNLHHYYGFFEEIRKSLREDKFEKLKTKISATHRGDNCC